MTIDVEISHNLPSDQEALTLLGLTFSNGEFDQSYLDWYLKQGEYIERLKKALSPNGTGKGKKEVTKLSTFVDNMADDLIEAYQKYIDRMQDQTIKYLKETFKPIVERDILIPWAKEVLRVEKLGKSIWYRSRDIFKFPLRQRHVDELQKVIQDNEKAFLTDYMGMGYRYDTSDLKRLVEAGLLHHKAKLRRDFFMNVYYLARFVDVVKEATDYQDALRLAKYSPLSSAERLGIEIYKWRGAMYIQGLGNNVAKNVQATFTNQTMEQIRQIVAGGKKMKMDWRAIESELKAYFKDYSRDWRRIAITETNNLQQWGIAQRIGRDHGMDAYVSKMPFHDACPHCIRLYVEKDGSLKKFTLKELIQNGSNYKKPVSEWKAVVESTHPHCRCGLMKYSPSVRFRGVGLSLVA